jgi:uncharacterized protein (TIRG00374 family)
MKRKLIVGVVASAAFLYLAVRGIDGDAFAAAFRHTNVWWLIPAVFFTMLGHYTRAWRWKSMMAPVKAVTIGPLWSATAIAFMVNNLFPARIGEFVRAYVIGKHEGVSKSAAFATIVYERVVDVFVLIVLLWYCLLTTEGPDWLASSAIVLILFNVVLLAILYAMIRRRAAFNALLARLLRPLPRRVAERVGRAADAFVEGLGVVTHVRALVPIVVLSVGVWGSAVLGVHFCVLAMGIDIPAAASLFLIAVISLGSMIPSAPAFVGTLQYACVVGLAVYGVDKSAALAFSTVYHATQFFPITAAGGYYAWRSSLRMAEISGRSELDESGSGPAELAK